MAGSNGKLSESQQAIAVTGSTSGRATFAMPLQDGVLKKVTIHISALVGTATYTFPIPFTNSPVTVTNSSTATLALVGSGPYTGVTVTGTASTGYISLEEQQ